MTTKMKELFIANSYFLYKNNLYLNWKSNEYFKQNPKLKKNNHSNSQMQSLCSND